jgi:Flp pilus assembly protein TadB
MPNDSSTNDPKTIWQNQPMEPSKMTLVMIRHKTQHLQAGTRRALLKEITASVFLISFYGVGIWWVHGVVLRAAFALAIVWTLAGQYFVDRGSLSESAQLDVSVNTSLQSYRREVERRRYLSGRFLLWSFGPVVLAIGALSTYLLTLVWNHGAWSHGYLLSTTPFFTLLVLWFVAVFVLRMRHQRELQREIDQLNEVESSLNP